MVLPADTYASRPRRCPSSSVPPSDSDVAIMPAPGTYTADSPEDGSRRVTGVRSVKVIPDSP